MQIHINTYGSYLHVKDQLFEIKTPDEGKNKITQIAAHKVTSIVMATGTALSTDAIKLAMINNVDIVFLEQHGDPIGRLWHSKLGSTTKIRKSQLQASLNELGLLWVKTWITAKVENQIVFIKDLKKHRPKLNEYLSEKTEKLETIKYNINALQADNVQEVAESIRGMEGTCGRLYFETISKVFPADFAFSGRSSRPAKDPFNAFLNYAYGMLYSKVEKVLIIAGLDPYLGFLHRDDYNQLSFVYDFIEPYRIYAEKVAFRLFTGKKVNQGHYETITNGVSLNKAGKSLLVEAFNKHTMEEVIRYKGKKRTRINALQMDAHEFANSLIN